MIRKAIIVTAPSGAGKSTVVNALRQEFPVLEFSVSACTRPRRMTETEGKEYHFLSVESFLSRVAQGEFVEWEEVYPGCYYGTLRSELDRITAGGKIPVFDVDVKGALSLKRYFGTGALALFIRPPSLGVLEQRLRHRGTEPEESLRKRLDKAESELDFAGRFDQVILNEDLAQAVAKAAEAVRKFLES